MVALESKQEEVCFKAGLTGFQITMMFFSLTMMLNETFNKDWQAFESAVDSNYGCLEL